MIIKFNGELDHHSTELARKKIDKKYLNGNIKNVIMDFSKLNFMDSSGIGLIIGRYKLINKNGGKLVIVCSDKRVNKIFEMSGIMKIIDIYPNIKSAVDKI